jgi:hypothetical protein
MRPEGVELAAISHGCCEEVVQAGLGSGHGCIGGVCFLDLSVWGSFSVFFIATRRISGMALPTFGACV